MAIQPPLDSEALKCKPAARGIRAPRGLSIGDEFCRLPSLGSADGSVAPDVCPLVLAAARASPAVLREDVQSDNTRATTPDGRATVGTAELSPRFDAPV